MTSTRSSAAGPAATGHWWPRMSSSAIACRRALSAISTVTGYPVECQGLEERQQPVGASGPTGIEGLPAATEGSPARMSS